MSQTSATPDQPTSRPLIRSSPGVPVALLVRVSTDRQSTARQVSELQAVAEAKGWRVVEVCEEAGISGQAEEEARTGLRRAADLAAGGQVKKVLVHEVSRLARKNSVVHKFVEGLEDHGVSLYWHAQQIETLMASGKRNPAAGVMLALLSEMARAEVETLRERINSGLAAARAKGVKLGRKVGSGRSRRAFLDAHRDVVRLLKDGHSIRNAAKISGKGISTVQRVKAVVRNDVS
jgi:DNA invertase Pin-like site-specific DNA recombinase